MSPSPRREWIEIEVGYWQGTGTDGLPPHGGSGLKYDQKLWEHMLEMVSLPTEGVD